MTNTTELIDEVFNLLIEYKSLCRKDNLNSGLAKPLSEEIITLIKDHYHEALVEGVRAEFLDKSCCCGLTAIKTINAIMK